MKKIQMSRPTPTAGDTTQPTRKRGFNYWSCCHCRLVGGSYLTGFPSLAEQGASKKQGPGTWTCPGLPRTPWRWWRQRNEKRPLPLPLRDRTNPNQPATSSGSGSLRAAVQAVVGGSESERERLSERLRLSGTTEEVLNKNRFLLLELLPLPVGSVP
jgi:hypothetical protein